LTRKLAPLQHPIAYGLLCYSTQWSRRVAKKEVSLVEFSENIKNMKTNNQTYLQHPKRSKNFMKQTKDMLSTCDDEWKRQRKGICERNGFYTKLWHITNASSLFFKFCELWVLLSVVCARIHLWYKCMHPLHVASHSVTFNQERKGMIHWVRPSVGTLSFSEGHFPWVSPDSALSAEPFQASGTLSNERSFDKWEKVIIL